VVEQLGMKKKDLMAEYEEKQRDIVNKCMEVATNLPRMSIAFSTMTCVGSSRTVTAVVSGNFILPSLYSGITRYHISIRVARFPRSNPEWACFLETAWVI
jgi:hypothetical protein